jgi:hypothetical protein
MPAAKNTVNLARVSYLGVRIGFILNTIRLILMVCYSIDKKVAGCLRNLFIKL